MKGRAKVKYLAQYAEPEIQLIQQCFVAADTAVVVPLRGEEEAALWESLSRAAAATERHALAIAVVNADDTQAPWVHAANARTLARLSTREGLLRYSPWLSILPIDRASEGRRFRAGEGVGHARKLGCDVALALHEAGPIACPWISTTDGDAVVERDYFSFKAQEGDSALLHPFRHTVERGESPALLLYEISLRYYVLGLRAARSPYAFHTIGSTIRFPAGAYAAVRGFPKREAAEDFYFLDKLSKVGRIRTAGGRVVLGARESARVPFGTGRAMSRIGDLLKAGGSFRMYDPRPFGLLGTWLAAVESFAESGDIDEAWNAVSEEARAVLAAQGARTALELAATTRRTSADRRRHVMTWFDGLKTLKFLHALRDGQYPLLPWREALARAEFLSGCPAAGDEVAILEWLRERDEARSPSYRN